MTLRDVMRRREPVIVYTGAGLRRLAALVARTGHPLPANVVEARGIRNEQGGRDWVCRVK